MSDDTGWDDIAAGWDSDPIVRSYATLAFDSLQTVLGERGRSLGGATVLDFGCGTGLLTERLAEQCSAVDAVDTSPVMLDVLGEKITAHGWTDVRTATDIPNVRERYDLVVASSVCSFLDDYPATVRRIAGTMRPGGVFVQWDWELDPESDDPHGLSRTDMATALDAAAFVDVYVDTGFELTVGDAVARPLIGVGTVPR